MWNRKMKARQKQARRWLFHVLAMEQLEPKILMANDFGTAVASRKNGSLQSLVSENAKYDSSSALLSGVDESSQLLRVESANAIQVSESLRKEASTFASGPSGITTDEFGAFVANLSESNQDVASAALPLAFRDFENYRSSFVDSPMPLSGSFRELAENSTQLKDSLLGSKWVSASTDPNASVAWINQLADGSFSTSQFAVSISEISIVDYLADSKNRSREATVSAEGEGPSPTATPAPPLYYAQFPGPLGAFEPPSPGTSYRTVTTFGDFSEFTNRFSNLEIPGVHWVHIIEQTWVDSSSWSFDESLVLAFNISSSVSPLSWSVDSIVKDAISVEIGESLTSSLAQSTNVEYTSLPTSSVAFGMGFKVAIEGTLVISSTPQTVSDASTNFTPVNEHILSVAANVRLSDEISLDGSWQGHSRSGELNSPNPSVSFPPVTVENSEGNSYSPTGQQGGFGLIDVPSNGVMQLSADFVTSHGGLSGGNWSPLEKPIGTGHQHGYSGAFTPVSETRFVAE